MSESSNQFRWGAWAGAVLSRVDNPEECRAVILQCQQEVDDDREEAELVEAEFRDMLTQVGHDPDRCCVWHPGQVGQVPAAKSLFGGASLPAGLSSFFGVDLPYLPWGSARRSGARAYASQKTSRDLPYPSGLLPGPPGLGGVRGRYGPGHPVRPGVGHH